jgi:hypothetical protein
MNEGEGFGSIQRAGAHDRIQSSAAGVYTDNCDA